MSCTGKIWRGGGIGLIVDADDEVDEVSELVVRLPGWSGEAGFCDCGAIRGATSSGDMLTTEL